MSHKLKEFAKDSLLYAVGDWLSKLGALILVPILSRIFLPSDYGIIDLLNTSYAFLLIIVSLNVDSGMQKFYYLREGQERKVLLSSSSVLRLILSSVFALVCIIFSREISLFAFHKTDYHVEISLLAAVMPIEDFFSQLMLILRLKRKPVSFSAYNVIQVVVQPILTYTCVVNLGLGIKGVFVAKLANLAMLTPILLLHQRTCFTREIDFRTAIELLKFSLPGLPAIVQTNVMSLLPRYFLVSFSTLTAVGLFGIGDRIARTVDLFKSSFNRAWNPFAFSNAGKEDEKYLYEKVFKIFAACLLLLTIVLTLFAKEIVALLTPPRYHSAAVLVGGICFYYGLRALTLVYNTGLYSANRVALTSLMNSVQLVVFVAGSFMLVPDYGVTGLVLSLDVSTIAYFVCYSLTVKKFFPFNFSFSRLFPMFMLTLAAIGYACYTSSAAPQKLTASSIELKFVFLIIYSLAGLYIILTGQERRTIGNRIRCIFLPRTLE